MWLCSLQSWIQALLHGETTVGDHVCSGLRYRKITDWRPQHQLICQRMDGHCSEDVIQFGLLLMGASFMHLACCYSADASCRAPQYGYS